MAKATRKAELITKAAQAGNNWSIAKLKEQFRENASDVFLEFDDTNNSSTRFIFKNFRYLDTHQFELTSIVTLKEENEVSTSRLIELIKVNERLGRLTSYETFYVSSKVEGGSNYDERVNRIYITIIFKKVTSQ